MADIGHGGFGGVIELGGLYYMYGVRGHRGGGFVGPAIAWGDQAQIREAEIGHGTGSGADILAELGIDEDNRRKFHGAVIITDATGYKHQDFPFRITALLFYMATAFSYRIMTEQAALAADNEWSLYTSAENAWDAMYADCLKATESIQMEQYILANDEIGRRFLRLFWQKAKAGLQVTLFFDHIGSRHIYKSRHIKALRRAGAQIGFFNALNWSNLLRPWTWFPRTHVKMLLVDKETAYIGSVCFHKDMTQWRDTHARLQGMAAAEIQKAMQHIWQRRRLRHAAHAPNSGPFRVAISQGRPGRNVIYRELLEHIARAKTRIAVATPYFIPPRRLLKALKAAALRGVQVHLMLAKTSDVALADTVSRRYFPSLLRYNIHIYQYLPVMYHAKLAIIDDSWAMVGSMNLDYLSLLRNRESNLLITDPGMVAALAEQYEEDKRVCERVTIKELRAEPIIYWIAGKMGMMLRQIL